MLRPCINKRCEENSGFIFTFSYTYPLNIRHKCTCIDPQEVNTYHGTQCLHRWCVRGMVCVWSSFFLIRSNVFH